MQKEKTLYLKIKPEVQEQIIADKENNAKNQFACKNDAVLRRDIAKDKASIWRPAFVRDCEKILHLPAYNRYSDKTQVFSFYKNDDLTRRALHVQLVSRIARSIGSVLNLNTDLIEAIALGHDIGHTPFGHAGEHFLSDLLHSETGLFFNHNVHSVRVLDSIYNRNISLQTLDGILCHNGEFELQEYRPKTYESECKKAFSNFDSLINDCDTQGNDAIKKLVPITLEACVVRVSDMIAYLGKDRQDAKTAKIPQVDAFTQTEIGQTNAQIINNLSVDIINNSYGKDYIQLSPEYFEGLKITKKENYQKIYGSAKVSDEINELIQPMFKEVYYKLLDDLTHNKTNSVIFKHHINFVKENTAFYNTTDNQIDYKNANEPNRIVSDFIASMTDDYFVDLHEYLFPTSKYKIQYKSYFEDL